MAGSKIYLKRIHIPPTTKSEVKSVLVPEPILALMPAKLEEKFSLLCHWAPCLIVVTTTPYTLGFPLPCLLPERSKRSNEGLTVESYIMVGEYRWAFGFGGAIHGKGHRAIRCLHRVSL